MSIGKLAGELVKETVIKFFPIPYVSTIITYIIGELTRQEKKLPQVNEELKRVLEQQEEILYRFDHKLNALIMNPIRHGKRYLIEAQSQKNKGDFEMFIQEAQWKFFDASDTELSEFPTLPIEAIFFSGICYDLLGKKRQCNTQIQ